MVSGLTGEADCPRRSGERKKPEATRAARAKIVFFTGTPRQE
jgi:hypothetical protein